jgi:hypothetical protein
MPERPRATDRSQGHNCVCEIGESKRHQLQSYLYIICLNPNLIALSAVKMSKAPSVLSELDFYSFVIGIDTNGHTREDRGIKKGIKK